MMKMSRFRYLLATLLFTLLSAVFAVGRIGMHPIHFWNRIAADASFAILCLTLIIGPAAKFLPRLSPLLPWRRELGIISAVGAGLHVIIYTKAFNWNPLGFFLLTEAGESVLLRSVTAAANWIGLLALVYMLVLAFTSNDLSQKWLGRGWKFLQQQSYTLFALVILHMGLFLYLVFVRKNGIIQPVFWWLSIITVGMQLAGYFKTVWQNLNRRGLINKA